jgi:serine/threonine protein kinase
MRKIGQGAFGDVYSALNVEKNVYCAVKFEKTSVRKQVLPVEMETLYILRNTNHFANVFFYGKFKEYKLLVMELLGPSLLFVVF